MTRDLAGGRDGQAIVTQLSRGTRFALQDGGKNLLPVCVLAGDGLRAIKALFQAESRLGLAQAQDAGAVRQHPDSGSLKRRMRAPSASLRRSISMSRFIGQSYPRKPNSASIWWRDAGEAIPDLA